MTGSEDDDTAPRPQSVPPAEGAARRRLQGLTVSVNYADYLECIAANVRHFDRWLVVTTEEDTTTQEVCRRHGMEVLFSRRLHTNGAAFHKAAALNEGLEALDQDAWVLVLDSDILLPRDFRDRLEAQELDPQCLYGPGGRRVCPALPEFLALAAHEPWADNLIYAPFVIGYFSLFHLSHTVNRYPELVSDDASSYDVVFSRSFPVRNRRSLPFICLHAGEARENWRGRVTEPFFGEGTVPGAAWPESQEEEIAALLGGPEKRVAQIGCYRGALSAVLSRHFGRVTVIDHWGLHLPARSSALTVDLQWLAARYARETDGLENVPPPLPHSAVTVAGIPDGSLDVLWLAAEPEYDFLLEFLPAWLPKLKAGGAITGCFFDPDQLPGPTRLVHLLLGAPEVVCKDGRWVRRVAHPLTLARRLQPAAPSGRQRGAVYVAVDETETEPLLISLSSLRRHWDGPVCVLCAGDESASLRLACLRLGIEFRNVPRASPSLPDDLCVLHALDWSPFEETVYIGNLTLVTGPLPFLWEALPETGNVFCRSQKGEAPGTPALELFAWRRGNAVCDAWRSLAGVLSPLMGNKAVSCALSMLANDGTARVLPETRVWNGAIRRVPEGMTVVSMHRLAKAGAMHLFPPWAEEEQALLHAMGSGPDDPPEVS